MRVSLLLVLCLGCQTAGPRLYGGIEESAHEDSTWVSIRECGARAPVPNSQAMWRFEYSAKTFKDGSVLAWCSVEDHQAKYRQSEYFYAPGLTTPQKSVGRCEVMMDRSGGGSGYWRFEVGPSGASGGLVYIDPNDAFPGVGIECSYRP
jgi:hypothetical protein